MFARKERRLLFALTALTFMAACMEKKPAASPKQTQIIKPVTESIQDKTKIAGLDKSPMDMIYYPPDYPVLKMTGKIKGLPVARVIYSRPFKDGRTIFGNVVKYGSYWRLGANESTEIEFFRDVTITGKRVKKGRYIIYCVPHEDKWTIKLNNDLYTWGLKVHSSGDLYSFDIPALPTGREIEVFTMQFTHGDNGAQLIMAWDSVRASLPIAL
jgi:hypothetical protein